MPSRFIHGYGNGGGVEVFHIIFTVLLFAAIAMLIVWLVTGARRGHVLHEHATPVRTSVDTALQEARLRYARGEMTREEFLQTSTDLGGPAVIPPSGTSQSEEGS
jgi:putative membrane protein